MVARWAHNPKVIGSNPFSATKEAQQSLSLFFVYTPQETTTCEVAYGNKIPDSPTLLRHPLKHRRLIVGD